MWQMDFKGEFALSSEQCCCPLPLLNAHSRFPLGTSASGNQLDQTIHQSLEKTVVKTARPFALCFDNGTLWGNNSGILVPARVIIWLMRHAIQATHGRPYPPQGHGKLKQEEFQRRPVDPLSRV